MKWNSKQALVCFFERTLWNKSLWKYWSKIVIKTHTRIVQTHVKEIKIFLWLRICNCFRRSGTHSSEEFSDLPFFIITQIFFHYIFSFGKVNIFAHIDFYVQKFKVLMLNTCNKSYSVAMKMFLVFKILLNIYS